MRVRLIAFLCLPFLCLAATNRGYYRYPAIHGETIIFTSEGDLWKVATAGGAALRLTTHPGNETRAAFSSDGSTIAFSATYEGPDEVYTMPTDGGLPIRRTYDGGSNVVVGWTPDGKILYASNRNAAMPTHLQLFTVDQENRLDAIPLSEAAQGCYSADGRTLFFTRLQHQGSSTKHYQGGTAENIWKLAAGAGEAIPLTGGFQGTSKNAMYWKDHVYFLTDRDGTMNLWSMNEEGKDLRQLTKHQGFDIETASLAEGKIVYSLAGDLRLFDIRGSSDKLIPVEVPSDFDNLREHWIKNPVEYLTSAHLSNDGESVTLTSRGRAFVVPAKAGRLVDLNANQPGRFREARLMPDGKSVLLISTESGETELWKYPANGDGRGEQLTKGAGILRWQGIPSPDGKIIAHQDRNQNLWLLDLASRTDKKIADLDNDDVNGPSFANLRWSPDSRWIVYSANADNGFSQIHLYGLDSGTNSTITSDRYNSGAASWSRDGKWLYFISDRAFKSVVSSPWGSRQPDPFFDRMNKIYAVSLKKGIVSAFEPFDEMHLKPPDPPPGTSTTPKIPEPAKVEVDFDGLSKRLQEIPVPPGNYSDLAVAEKRMCWIDHDAESAEKDSLQCLDIANKGEKPQTLLEGSTRIRNFW